MKTQNLIRISIMTAMIAIGAFIRIPAPVIGSFTLQLTFVLLAGLLLGKRDGAIAATVYAVGGLAGIPWFINGGGITYVFQPTFGFILSFILAAYLVGWFREVSEKRGIESESYEISLGFVTVGSIIATILVWILGMLYLASILQFYLKTEYSYLLALTSIISPSFVMDIILAFVVVVVGLRIYKRIGKPSTMSV